MFCNFAWCFYLFWLLIFCLIFCTSVSDDSRISCFIIIVERSFDKIKEDSYFWFEISAKIGIPSPPNFEGSDNSFLSILEQCIPPVIVVMNSDVITWSSWFSWSEMSSMVPMMYDGLCLHVVMKQEYAAWGFAFAIIDKTFISFIKCFPAVI